MRVRLIVGDQQSAEFEQLRRTVNNLLRMMETAKASLVATATAADVLTAWSDAIETGRDNNPGTIANVVSTDNEVLGLRPTPTPVRKAQAFGPVQDDDGFDR
jgi:hypothetical protein